METLQKFFILHARPFRETSLLLDCLTEHHGYISLLAKGVKQRKTNVTATFQPFQLLLGQWRGRSNLKVIYNAELVATPRRHFVGKTIYSGMYVNELLSRLLHKQAPCEGIFVLYQTLMRSDLTALDLRCFEKALLKELGYDLQLSITTDTHQPVEPQKRYHFTRDFGLIEAAQNVSPGEDRTVFDGASLLAMAKDHYPNEQVMKDARRLMRLAFIPLLGEKPLKIREIMRQIV
jgi:DNA repair protein RecO (recombination protein O)